MIETPNWAEWRADAERVVALLLQAPVSYILLDDELPPGSCDGCWGITWPDMSAMLRDEIGARWAGAGPALILNLTSLERSLPSDAEDRRNSITEMVWGVVCHEIAHALRYDDLSGGGLSDGLTKQDFVAIPSACTSAPPHPAEHGPGFCWTALHVRHRLSMHGIAACLVAMIDYIDFGLPRPAYVMKGMIAQELTDLQSLPLSLIVRIDPPAEFLALFVSDASIVEDPKSEPVLKEGKPMSEFFDRLKETKAETVRQHDAAWRLLVITIADDQQIDEHGTVTTLDRLGKSPDDLQNAVTMLQRRRQLTAKIAAAEKSTSELPHLEAKEREANLELAEAQAKHQRAVLPLLARREGIWHEQQASVVARDELLRQTIGSAPARELKTSDDALDLLRRQQLKDADKCDDLNAYLRAIELAAEPERQFGQLTSTIARLQTEIAERSVEIRESQTRNEQQRAMMLEADFVA